MKELLIEFVRTRPVLYSKAHKDYKETRTVKQNNWNDIPTALAKKYPESCASWTGEPLVHRMYPITPVLLILKT